MKYEFRSTKQISGEGLVKDLLLFGGMLLGEAGGRGARFPAADKFQGAWEFACDECPGAHVLGFFLHPQPARSVVVFREKSLPLLCRQWIQLFAAHDGDIVPVRIRLPLREIVIDLPAAQQYTPHVMRIG